MSLLRLKNVSRVFGRLTAFQDIDLEMEEGKVYAMIGPNGAGKTTLFNLISGFFPATTGEIWFEDKSINGFTPEERVAGLVRTFQITEVFPELSVAENIRIGVEAQGELQCACVAGCAADAPGQRQGRRVACDHRADATGLSCRERIGDTEISA